MIPKTVANGMMSGVVGELSHWGPSRVRVSLLDSTDQTNNKFGRAFTFKDDAIETVQAGGAGKFAGIMIHPKAHMIEEFGVPNGATSEFLSMGEIYAEVAGVDEDTELGAPVYYVAATGALTLVAEGNTAVPNAILERHLPSVETPNLAIIRLTN